jgi:hypothetical protein
MADMTMILPYDRISPLHIPQRDLVLSSADSLWLTVTIVESDNPSAQALCLTGGIGGPACMLAVWPDRRWHGSWDYGMGAPWAAQPAGPVNTLWTGVGMLSDAIGSFDIFMPAATMATWPRRCAWGVLLDFDGGGQAELIAEGHLHVRPMVSRGIIPTILLTDPLPAVLTDNPVDAIFIDGAPP